MGSKYAIFSKELIIKITTGNKYSASKEPTAMLSLLHRPAVGGKPMIAREPIKKAPIVSGICLPTPSRSLTFFTCSDTKMAPAQKNKVILPKA